MKQLRACRRLIGTSMIALLSVWQIGQPLQGATFYWDADQIATGNNTSGANLGGTGTWDATLSNWWDGSSGTDQAWPNVATDTAIFAGTAGVVTTGAPLNVNNLTFNTSGYTLTGSATNIITLGGTTPGVTLGAGVTTATISALIAGSAGLTFDGGASSGTLLLNSVNANSHTGTTSISSGTLQMASLTALGASGAGNATTVNSGGALRVSINGTVALEQLSLAGTGVSGGGALVLDSGRTSTWTGLLTIAAGGATINTGINSSFVETGGITATGNLIKAGAGRMTMSTAASSGAGTLTVNAGTFSVTSSSSTIGWRGTGNITVNSGGTYQSTGSGTNSITDTLTLTVNSGGALDWQQTGAESLASIILNGTGINNTGAFVTNAATAGGAITATGGITLGSNTTIGALSGGRLTLLTAITGAGNALTKVGLGELRSTNSTTASKPFGDGNIVLQEGMMSLVPGTAGAYAFTGANAAAGSTFTYNGGGTFGLTRNGTNTLSYTIGNAGATADAVLVRSGKGTLVIAPTALANMGGVAAGSENFVITNQTLASNKNGASSSAGIYDASVVGLASSVGTHLSYGTGAGGLGGGFAPAAYTTTGTGTTVAATTILDVISSISINDTSNPYALRVGPTVTLTNSGITTVNGGAFSATNSGIGGVILNAGATLTTNDAVITGGTLAFGSSEGVIFVATAGTGVGVISSAITGSAGLTKFGPGTLVLSSASNSFTGGVNINSGTLSVGADAHLGGAANGITFNGAANLTLTTSALTWARSITLNNNAPATITITPTSGTAIISGAITGSGGLSLTPTATLATLTLSSTANTFTGALRTNTGTVAGTIVVNSLVDSATLGAGNIQLGGTTTGAGIFSYGAGAIAPLTLNNRQIELMGTTGTYSIDNSNATAANAITINTDLLITGVGAKTLALTGANAGANTFAGRISDTTAAALISLTKSGTGNWILSNTGNTFNGTIASTGTTTSAGTLTFASAGGANPITVTQTTSTFTLKYIGAGQTISGAMTVAAMTTGTFTLDASGTGAINYSNAASLGAAGSGNKNLILTGSNTGTNTFAGQYVNNTGGAATLTKNGFGQWVLTNANTYSGATTINSGTLTLGFGTTVTNILGSSSALALGNATLNLAGTGAATSQTVASTALTAGTTSTVNAAGGTGGLTLALGTITRGALAALNINTSGTITSLTAGATTSTNNIFVDANGVAYVTLNGTDWAGTAGGIVAPTYSGDTYGTGMNSNVTASGSPAAFTTNTLRFNSGTPTLTLTGTNVVEAGGILIGSGAGAVTIDGTGTLAGAFSLQLGVFQHSATAATISAGIVNNGGATAFNKYGNGRLNLAGTNTYTGATTVVGGTLALSGSLVNAAAIAVNQGVMQVTGTLTTGAGIISVGNTANTRGVFNVQTGATISTANFLVGNNATGSGALNISGGTVTTTAASLGVSLGAAGYGTLVVSGGALNTIRLEQNSTTATSTSVVRVSGGTLAVSEYIIVRVPNWEYTITGGQVLHNAASQNIALNYTGGGVGALTVAGGGLDNTGRNISFGQNTATGTSIVNLNSGTLTTNAFVRTSATGYLSFNGGTLRPGSDNSTLIAAGTSGVSAAYVNGAFGAFAGGAVIDTNGKSTTIAADLLAPTGNGVTSLAVPNAGSGYIGAPFVSIVGTGTGASAMANMVDDGTGNGTFMVGSITITNPGVNYTGAVNYTLLGGGATTPANFGAPAAGTIGANTSGGLTKTGAGMLILSGTNTYTGVTTVSAGILQFAKEVSLYNNTPASWTASNIVVESGATLAFGLGGTGGFTSGDLDILLALGTGSGGFKNGSVVGFDTTANFTYGSVIADPNAGANVLGVTKFGAGTLTLSGTNTNTGVITISAGTLSVATMGHGGVASSLGQSSNAAANLVFDGGTLKYTGATQSTDRNFTINAGKTAIFDITTAGTTLTLAGSSATNGALTKMGAGSLSLTGTNGYTGITTVNQGTLTLDFSAGFTAMNILSSSSPLTLSGGALNVIGAAAASSQTVASTTLAAGTYNVISAAAGVGGLTLDLGALTLNLNSGLNINMTGSPVVTLSGVTVANGIAVGSNGAAFLTLNGTDWGSFSGTNPLAATYATNDFSLPASNVDVTTSASPAAFTVNTLRFNTGSPTLTLVGTNTLSAGGLLIGSGAGSVIINGTGTLAGSAAAGTVAVPVPGELGIFQHSASALTISAPIVNSDSGLSFLLATPTGTTLNKYGTGTLILSSTRNAWTGGTNIDSGTLRLGVANALPYLFVPTASAEGLTTVSAAGTLDMNGFSQILNGLSGTGTVDNTAGTAATLAVGRGNATSSFAGTLHNSGSALSLLKVGTGTLTLAGSNTYSGTTTIAQGTVKLDFTLAGAPQTNILPATALVIGSGTLNATGSFLTNSQSFSGTTLAGGATVSTTGTTPGVTLNLGALTRNAGSTLSVLLGTAPTGSTTTITANTGTSILGGWAVTGATVPATWAVSAGNGTTAGAITGLADASYLTTTTAGVTSANYLPTSNVDVTSTVVLTGGAITINSLRYNGAAANTLTLLGTAAVPNVISTGGILVTATVGSNSQVLSGGNIIAPSGGELIISNYNTNTNRTITINNIIGGTGANNFGLTIMGTTGTVALRTATNTYTGQTVINGGILSIDANARIGASSGVTLNGGTLTHTDNFNMNRPITLGLAGGTLNYGAFDGDGGWSSTTAIGFLGSGPRTLTLGGDTDQDLATLAAAVGDGGGPTSLTVNGGTDDSIFVLNPTGASTYSGTTTFSRGVLRLNSANAIGGGLLSTADRGNFVFTATGTNRAILEINALSGPVTRSVGYGPGQIHWEGNGGFSTNNNVTETAPSATQIVNLGGAGVKLTWGAGGFVPTGQRLQFGNFIANSNYSAGAVDFQNGIELGTLVRTIEATRANGTTSDRTPAILEAILSGDITSGAGGGFDKVGTGTIQLAGSNSGGLGTISVTQGTLYFSSTSAIMGTGANITLSTQTNGLTGALFTSTNAAIGVANDANPISTLGGRIANASSATAAFLLSADSSATLDFSSYPNMRLAGFAFQEALSTPVPLDHAVTFTGSIIPAGATYRLGGQALVQGVTNSAASTLVFGRQNILTGANALNMTYGALTLIASNDYSGGTVLNGNAITIAAIGVGSDSSFGTGLITLAGTRNIIFGAVNGDHSVSNNIAFGSGSTGGWVVGGDGANDSILANVSQGTLSYLGTVDMAGRTNPAITGRVRGALFLGDVTGGASGLNFLQSAGGYFSFLATSANGGVAKTYSGTTTFDDNTTFVFDHNDSFGTGGTITTEASAFYVQPGTASVTLAASRSINYVVDNTMSVNTPSGSTLTIQGVFTGGGTGALNKSGLGTLILQGQSPAASTSGTLTVGSGTLRLDAATAGGTVWVAGLPLALGTASGTFGNGGTLEITGTSGQSFGAVTVNARANNISLTGGMTLTLVGAITRTAGGTLNFSVPTGSVTSTHTAVAGLVNGATTWNSNDWAGLSGGIISQYTGYTALTGTLSAPTITLSASANYHISSSTTNNVVLATAGTLAAPVDTNTLKYSDPTNRTLDVRTSGGTAGFLLFGGAVAGGGVTGPGGILVASGAGALTIGVAPGATGGSIMAGGTTTNTLSDLVIINNSSNAVTVNSAIVNNNGTTGTSPLVLSGSGKVILAGNNTHTGSITINSGVLEVATVNISTVAGPLGQSAAGAGNILLNGGTFRANLSTDGNTNHGFTVNAPSIIEVVASTLTIDSTLLGVTSTLQQNGVLNAGNLKKTGAGTLELKDLSTNANNANLSIEVVEGTLILNKVSGAAISAVDLAGGAALLIGSAASGSAPTVIISGTLGNQISDASSVVVKGDLAVKGVLDLNGRSETIDGLAGTGIVTNNVVATSTLTLGGNNSAGLAAYTLAAAAAGVNATGLNNFGGVIQDGGAGKVMAVTKTGSGTQIFTAVQTYSGATTISAGTLRLGIANALPSGAGKSDIFIVGSNTGVAVGGSGFVLAPGTLDMGGFDQVLNGLNSTTGGFVTNSPILSWNGSAWVAAASTNALTLGGNNATASFDGVIQDGFTVAPGITASGHVGTINLIKIGTGTQTLKGASTYGGSTAIRGGSVIIAGDNNRLPTGTSLVLGSGSDSGVLQIGDSSRAISQQIAGLSTSGSGTANAVVGDNVSNSTLVLNLTGTSSYSGALGGGGANQDNLNFILQGGGTLTLNGAVTLAGATTVRQGSVLILDSNLPNSAVTLGGSIGGTLISNNTLGGLITVNSGGVVAPGDTLASDVTTLTLNGGLTLNNGGTLALQIGSAGGAGFVGDLIMFTGGLFTINGGEISLTELTGGNPVLIGTYDLIDYTGATGFTGFSNLSLASSVIGASNYFVILQDTGTKIQAVVDNARFWSGATDGQWNTSVANWSPANFFVNGDKVIFQDTFPSLSGNVSVVNASIDLNATVTPAAISFNNTLIDYSLRGTGDITGTTGLSKSGTGNLTISNANTFAGNTIISGGYIEMQNAAALGTTGSIAVSQSGAALRLSGGIAVGSKALSLIGSGISSGGALRNVSGNNSYAGAITLNADARINSDAGMLTLTGGITNGSNALTFGGAGDVAETGVIGSGDGSLIVDGTGMVILGNNANTYTGKTFIKSGTLSVSKIGSVGVSGGLGAPTGADATIVVGDSITTGILKWTGSSNESSNRAIDLAGTTGGAVLNASGAGVLTLTGSLTFSGSGSKTLTLTGTGGTAGAPNVLSGVIGDPSVGATSLLKEGSGAWRLDGGGGYTGSTTVNGGILMLGISDSMPVTAPIIANGSGGATLSLNGHTQTFNGITFGGVGASSTAQGTVALGSSSTLKLGGSVTYAAIGNPLGASITGSGTATLDLGGDDAAVASVSRTFNVGSSSRSDGADLTISAVIADAGGVVSGFANGITKTGAGTLVLTGANTYTGVTTVDGGVLSVNPAALGATTIINVGTNGASGQLNFYADNAAAGITLASNARLNIGGAVSTGVLGFNLSGAAGSDTLTFVDTLGGADLLTVGAGGGVINARALTALAGTSYLLIDDATNVTYTPTTITGFTLGILTGGYTYALDNSTAGQLKLTVGAANSGPYYWNGSLSSSWATLGGGGSITNWSLNQNGTVEAGATPGGVVVNFVTDTAGNVSTTLDQPYSISGLNFISSASGAGNVTIAAGSGDGKLAIGANGIDVQTSASSTGTLISAPVILGAAQSWNVVDSNKTLTVSGGVSGDGSLLTKTGSGALVLSGVNTYNGGTAINGGTVQIDNASSLGATIGTVTINAATLQATANITDSRNLVLGNSGSVILVDGAKVLSFINTASTLVSGTGVLNTAGAGTLVLDDTLNANTFSGGSVLSGGGTVRIYTATGLGGGAATINAATLWVSGTFSDGRNITLGHASSAVSVDSGKVFTIANTGGSKITGSGILNASGAGVLILDDSANANDFSGGSVLSGRGTIKVATNTALGSGAITINAATLQATASIIETGRVYTLGSSTSTLSIDSGATYTITNTGGSKITGSGMLNASGAGVLILDDSVNANDFSGGSVLSGGGTVKIATATSLGASGGAATINHATLQATADITSSRNFLLGSYGSKFAVDAGKTYNLSGTINDGAQAGTLNKIGGGTLVVSGSNGYSGGTFVTAGTLRVSNSSGSGTGTGDVIVSGAGTILDGTGMISGIVTIGSGAILAPGASPGTLTLGGLALASGSLLNYEIGAVGASDKTIVGAKGFTANGGQFTLSALSGFTSGTYNLITYVGTLGGSFSNLSLASNIVTDLSSNVYFVQLVNNPGSVDLASTNSLTWNGNIVGTIWDSGASANSNWKSGATTGINFYNTMAATFDDTAAGYTVNIPGTVTPLSITVSAANSYTFQGAGTISGGTGITKSGAGSLLISNANSFTGNIVLSAGSIEMQDPAALGTTGTISITPGASLRFNSATSIALGTRITSIGGGVAIQNVSGNNSATLPGPITAATSFVSDAGTLTLAGNVTSTSLALQLLGDGNITMTGSSINIADSSFTVNTGGTVTVANTVATGTSGVVINGTGTTILNGTVTSASTSTAGLNVTNSGTNSFGANVTVNGSGGGITINQSGGSTTFGANVTTGSGGLTITNTSSVSFNGTTVTTGNGTVTVSGAATATFASNITSGTGLWTISSSDNTTVNGVITGSGAMTKSGAGTLTLSRVNTTYTGAVSLAAASGQNRGIILASASNALGTGAVTTTFATGATLAQLQLSGGITLGNSGFTISGGGTDGTNTGIIRSINGANIITGAVTIAGSGSVAGATLRADSTTSLAFNGAITASAAGRFLNLVGGGDFSFGSAGSINDTGANTVGLWSTNSGTTTVGSTTSTYTLATGIGSGSTLNVAALANGGSNSSIGAAVVTNTNLVIDNGTLKFTGSTAQSTDRLFSIGSGGATLDASGTGAGTLSFTGLGALGFNGITGVGTSALQAGARTLTLTGTNTGANTLASVIADQAAVSGLTSLVKSGAGTWILGAINTYTGKTSINAGRLSISSEASLGGNPGAFTADQLTLNGGTLKTTATLAIDDANRGITIGVSGGTFETDTSTVTTVNSVILGSGTVTKIGAGTLVFAAANAYSGKTAVTGGTLGVSADSGLGAAPGSSVGDQLTLDGGTLLATETFTLNANRGVTLGVNDGVVNVDSGKTLTVAGVITGGAGADLSKTGAGTLALAAFNTYSGKTLVTGGTLGISADSGLGAAPGGFVGDQLTLDGGTLQATETFTLDANRGVTLGVNDGVVNVDSGKTLTVAGVITGGAGADLSKTGIGTLLLAATNTYTGLTTVSAGVLAISNASALGSTTNGTSVAEGGTLSMSGGITVSGEALLLSAGAGGNAILNNQGGNNTWTGNLTVDTGVDASNRVLLNSESGKLTVSGNVNLSAGTQDFVLRGDGDGEISGQITGSQRLFKSSVGTGTWILSGDNSSTFTGRTTISNGAVQIASESNLGVIPGSFVVDQLTLGGGSTTGTLKTTASTSLGANRGITIAAGGGAFDTAAFTTLTVDSAITGSGDIAKEGAGTLLLTAVNTNTGTTTVNAGVLGGTGTVGGHLTVASGGTLAPGTTATGLFSIGGNLTVNSGGTLLMELGGPTTNAENAVRGHENNLTAISASIIADWESTMVSLHDQITSNGGSAPVINGTFKIAPAFLNTYTLAFGDVFNFLDWTTAGDIGGTPTFDFSGISMDGLSFNTQLFASNGIIVVVPEPSRVLFLMLGLFGLMLRRRRR